MKLFSCWIFVVIFVSVLTSIVFIGCSKQDVTAAPTARFSCTPEAPFSNEAQQIVTYQICTDNILGHKYLYLWGGMGNGGPAITKFLGE